MTVESLNVADLVLTAEERIRPYIRQTILEHSQSYSQQTGACVYFKCENLQHTGSFKARGAMNKILSLSGAQKASGIVTASTGNHGAAVARSLSQIEAAGIVFVPENADPAKVAMIQKLGAEVRYRGNDSAETEVYARAYAAHYGGAYIPPYNDPVIIGGQGTIGVELIRQLENIDAVFISVGGGGLIAGIAGYLKSVIPNVQVIGCSPENSQVMIKSIQAGRILDLPSLPTLSDGTAGGVEAGSITFPLCQRLVDSFVTVTEDQITVSLKIFMATHHMLIEGSAAVAIAAFLKVQESYRQKNVVILLCGANISLEVLKEVLSTP
jgi:threonine dehydratase